MKKVLIISGIIIVAGIAYYGISPLFDTKVVNDELPGMEDVDSTATTTGDMDAMDDTGTTTDTETTNSGPQVLAEGPVEGTTGHPASGTAKLIQTEGSVILRYEDFKTINGPELHVYLSTDKEASDFIDLGDIRGTEGNINYTVPAGTDLSKYRYALIWCKPFGVLFNSAKLQ